MQEKIKGFLRDRDKPASLDNLDFDSYICLKRAKNLGHGYEFGRYNWKDGSVEIAIERPDPAKKILPESQEEWEKKRRWYLENAGTCLKTLLEGINEGYLIDRENYWDFWDGGTDWIIAGAIEDQLIYELIYSEEIEDQLDSMNYDWLEEQEEKQGQREKPQNPKEFLQEGKRVNYSVIGKAARLKERMLRGERWSAEDFKSIGFRLPPLTNSAEESDYILGTLGLFLDAVEKRRGQYRRSMLSGLVRSLGLSSSLVNEARQDPWEVYGLLKKRYCRNARSGKEYDRLIADIVLALGV